MKIKFLSLVCVFLILLSFSGIALATNYDANKKTSMDFTAEYEALSDEEKKEIREASDKWYMDHTFNATITKTFTVKNLDSKTKELIVEEVYESKDSKFEKMFGTNAISNVDSYVIDTQTTDKFFFEGKEISLNSQFRDVYSIEKKVVMTTESDPYDWRAYGYSYPANLWKNVNGRYYETDPINLIWHNTSVNQVKNTIQTHAGWSISLVVAEYKYYVYDSGLGRYVSSTSVASDPLRPRGGQHARIYPISYGYVVAGVHQDSQAVYLIPPYYESHQITNFEGVETMMANYFKPSYGWSVASNSEPVIQARYYQMDYGYPSVYNNGYATVITKV
jgi:hypothetical protein